MNDTTCDRSNEIHTPACQRRTETFRIPAHFHTLNRQSRRIFLSKLLSDIEELYWPDELLTDATSDGRNLKVTRRMPL